MAINTIRPYSTVNSFRDLDYQKFSGDLNDLTATRIIKGKELNDLFDLINSDGFMNGETYDGFLARENLNGFITFHFFYQGDETFAIILGFNSVSDIGALKILPTDEITENLFTQGNAQAGEPVNSLIGIFFSIGGQNVVFTLVQDLNNIFELTNNNELRNTATLTEGEYKIVVKSEGNGGTEYIDVYTVVIATEALITNINLSSLLVEESAAIGTSVGGLSTNGGQLPITYTLLAQGDFNTQLPIDLFEIVGNELKTKDAMGLDGSLYELLIQAEDSRSGLPDDDRIKNQTFIIEVTLDTFINSNSFNFNGIDENLEIPDPPSVGTFTKFSVSAWLNPSVTGASQYFISKFGAAGQRSWGCRVNISGQIAMVYSDTGVSSDTTTSVSSIPFGSWSHVAITFNGSTGFLDIYINGVLDVHESTLLSSLFNCNVDLVIGALYLDALNLQSYYEGLIDEVSIYNNELTLAQVVEIYDSGTPTYILAFGSAADMISWWRMGDDFSGAIQPDIQGTNDLTAINMNNSNKSTDVAP